ncbi:glutathione S-transferase family protein [Mesorhizobium sp. VNQ89]|uniref:glutathione S-transferase family protein n=1 Tax=Mesorhizobium quangtriensis TaxID=3157709 RepID=UPI0032B80529
MTILLYDLVGEDHARPFSPHCWKTAMSLAHKGLPFRSVPTPFTAVPSVEGGVSKTIPVIRDSDTVVADSFDIALYLDATYPDRPTLFGGKGGEAMARFIERWSQLTIHPYLGASALTDIHARLAPVDQAYFRESRERRYGKTLEAVAAPREEGLSAFRASLEPLRSMLTYQPFIGGEAPLYPDYVVFGAFQWVRIMSPFKVLEGSDPVTHWFERLLDFHGGLGRSVAAA